MNVRILPATTDRFDDVEITLTGGGDGPSCQCQWWTLPAKEFQARTRDEKEQLLRDEVGETPSPGLVAYVDDAAAGWVRIGPRTRQPRLLRTRLVTAHTREPLDDAAVWAVSCFSVRKEHRRAGLMAPLLSAAIDHARTNGARVVEAYPFDPTVKKRPSNELYHGVLSTFVDAGFDVVAQPTPDRALVALTLRE
ncbi:GNAT family N-acetyltransferase [Microbacterium sp. RD1]|uniref:GNAT family N-acetyltransferase n=1 Tax=Microbacterium sp. RD1 TaxID=3457313 RepID=UPI003FA54B76